MTLETWLYDWLQLRTPELAPRTLEQYENLVNRWLVPRIGAVILEDLTADTVRHTLAEISGEGFSRTAELCYVLLTASLRDYDPGLMARVRRPAHRQQRPVPWSDENMAMYVAACQKSRHGTALLLAILCGLRRGEICGLTWSNVDFEAEELHIVQQRQRLADGRLVDCPPKSLSSIRTVPIPAPLLARLRASRGLPGAYVDPITPSGLDAAHRALVKRLGLPPLPLHGLRHSMATACVRHGGDIRSLQAILGHASYATTANIYTHPDRGMLRHALDVATSACYTVLHM